MHRPVSCGVCPVEGVQLPAQVCWVRHCRQRGVTGTHHAGARAGMSTASARGTEAGLGSFRHSAAVCIEVVCILGGTAGCSPGMCVLLASALITALSVVSSSLSYSGTAGTACATASLAGTPCLRVEGVYSRVTWVSSLGEGNLTSHNRKPCCVKRRFRVHRGTASPSPAQLIQSHGSGPLPGLLRCLLGLSGRRLRHRLTHCACCWARRARL